MNFDGSLNNDQLKLMQESISIADQVVWQSQHCRDIWKNFVDTSKGVIVHNGVDTNYYNEYGEGFKEINSPKIRLLNVNFSTFKHKRVDILLELIKATPEEYHWYTMGQYLDTSITNDTNMFKSLPNVTFFGPVASYTYEGRAFLASVYRACDALVFTSEMEGSPNTVLEAAACGLPIIYNSSNSVVEEILGDFCIPISDADDFKTAIQALKYKDVVSQIKEGMRHKIENYTAEVMAKNYLKVFEGVM
jgi:glycosyltransferase involved in cell wall biosynthesis